MGDQEIFQYNFVGQVLFWTGVFFGRKVLVEGLSGFLFTRLVVVDVDNSARRKMYEIMVKCSGFSISYFFGGMSHKTIRPIMTYVIKMLSPIMKSNSNQ